MNTLVPDASIILKWALEREGEPDFQKAFKILQDFLEEKVRICLPGLWRYEVGNVLGRKQPQKAGEIFEVLLSYQFDEVLLDETYGRQVLDLMKRVKGVSFYDASYHVLAMREGGLFITADRSYYRRVAKEGSIGYLPEMKVD